MPLSTLPHDLMSTHIACFLGLVSFLQLRTACKGLNDMFLQHMNDSPATWMPLVTSAGFTWATPYVLEHMKKGNLTLLRLLYQFRPALCFPPAADAFCLWVTVKSVTDHTTLCVATSGKYSRFCWENNRWCFHMNFEWRSKRSSVVKHVVPRNRPQRAGDRWIVETSIELYMWSKIGMTKIGAVEIGMPNKFGSATDFIYNRIYVCLTSDAVTVGVNSCSPHMAEIFQKYADNPLNYPPLFNQFANTEPEP